MALGDILSYIVGCDEGDVEEYVPGLKQVCVSRAGVGIKPSPHFIELILKGCFEEAFKKHYPEVYTGQYPNGKLVITEPLYQGTQGYVIERERPDLEFIHTELEDAHIVIDHKFKVVITILVRDKIESLEIMSHRIAERPISYGVEAAARLGYPLNVYLFSLRDGFICRYRVEYTLKPNFKREQEPIYIQKYSKIQYGKTFTFNEEEELIELEKTLPDQVEAYRMYKRGMLQDDIKKRFGVTQSAISKWISKVKGELSRRMGVAYEFYRKQKLEERQDVDHVIYDGRKGKPDFIVYLKDGSVEVISSKCYYSDRKSVSIKRAEIEPEIQEALRLRAQGRRVRLLVDYYNLHDKHHEMREIPLDKIPPRLLFQHT